MSTATRTETYDDLKGEQVESATVVLRERDEECLILTMASGRQFWVTAHQNVLSDFPTTQIGVEVFEANQPETGGDRNGLSAV